MRCFFAISIPPEIIGVLRLCAEDAHFRLKRDGIESKPVDAANFHITLRFLGEVNPKIAGILEQRLAGPCSAVEPFDISIAGIGGFPDKSRPKVIWAGLRAGMPQLVRLHDSVEGALEGIGAEADTRKYHPHITLVRSGGLKSTPGLSSWMNENRGRIFGEFKPSALELFKSELRPSGPIYRPILKLPFKGLS